jgi:hypothetical protein
MDGAALTLGYMRLRGEHGEVVTSVEYVDKAGVRRKVLRLTRHGVHIADVESIEDLARYVDLADLAEDG